MTTWASASWLRVLVASLVLVSLSVKAWADDNDDAVAKITQMNKDAVAAYQAKKFDDAKKILKQALDLADTAGLQQHPITARTHIHMGIVIIGGFNQRELGIKQFKKALEIESTINLTKSLVTPELSDAFAEAKSGAGSAAAPAAPPATESAPEAAPEAEPEAAPAAPPAAAEPEAAPEASGGLVHEPITSARRGSAISITVGVPGDLKFDKMVLAYRPDGASEFLGRQMKEVAEGRYGAEIPTTATGGASVAYYVEADDADGNAVATKGTIDKPLVIALGGGSAAAPHKSEDSGDEEDDGTPDHQYFVALMLGTGFGWATGVGDTNHDVSISPAGMALAGLGQIAPEFGYWWSSSLLLSVQLRYQYITGTTDVVNGGKDYHTAHYAFAAFAKATWKLGDDDGSLHPFFSLAAGGGQIRHVVTFGTKLIPQPTGCGAGGMQSCVDTIAGGPFLVGPGGGVLYDLTDSLSLIGQLNTQLGLPNFTFNVDINVGAAMQF